MIKKQDLLQVMADENLQDEDLMEIISKYPEEMTDEDAKSLQEEIDQYAMDNALLAKAYEELADDLDDHAQMVVDTLDNAVTKVASSAHDDLTWANAQLDE